MAELTDLSWKDRVFLKTYRWRTIDPVPWAPLARPLAESRLALVSSAGLVTPDQEPFDPSIRGGDPSFREIPADVDVASLIDTHRSKSFDHEPVRADPNIALPIDRVRELAGRGRIGEVGRRHLSFMGSLTAVGSFVGETVPAAVDALVEDRVDVALLVPV